MREKILPAAWLDLKVNFGGAVQAYEADQAEPIVACAESWSVGLWSEYHVVDWPLDMRFFGVSFKPGGAYPFLQIPLSELHNRVVSLDAIWGHFAAEIRERLYAAPTVQESLALLERLLLARLCLCEAAPGLNLVQYALGEVSRNHGAVSIRALSDQIGISQNHLGTHFKRLVGGTPKELARLYRFQHVLDRLDPTRPVDWTWVAHQSLYYDQSHFNKDFVAFTGHSPTDYLRLRRQIHTENPQHSWYLRALPTD
jgi:AraC-like DNA-binding protein